MSYLTRHERDALVMLATAFGVSFIAGLFSYRTVSGAVVYDYTLAVGLLMIGALVFLIYRALRRAGAYAIKQYRGRSA